MKKNRIGILSFPGGKTGITPLSNLIEIINSISKSISLITGNSGYEKFKNDERVHLYPVSHISSTNIFFRVLNYFNTQLKMSYYVFKLKDVDLWLFFIGGDALVIPMLTAKLMRKKVILIFAGSFVQSLKASNDFMYILVRALSSINCKLSDNIVLYSKYLIKEWKMERYQSKILVSHRHFINFEKFNITKSIETRQNFVGYIGRLSSEKGILNLIKSVEYFKNDENNIKFLIIGEGSLNDELHKFLKDKDLEDKVIFFGWKSHEEISDCLNELKLLVVPSYTEGLPNIIIEAMACGTPVLTTKVGGIPDLVHDGETGFLLNNNSPECISKEINKALYHPHIKKIIRNAHDLVLNEFEYNKVVKKWSKIIN
jgi:glycosyltransferase involved in cell wall biosynthesis